ncbi:MAG: hypothetical protein A3F67_11750 [Verrucomicrobia bacterium RIFCSPHIGHO2_12_FULL_41_10]|nr:MAG: hypothetical protein A3F67_11750 [Verrucomicrobia bacterium RIFCSPHIGHO2_12_FULL_41_10]
MAKSKTKRGNEQDTIEVFRYPLFASLTYRGVNEDKDQRFVNCFPEALLNETTGAKKFALIKRAGTSLYATPKSAGGVGRGMYVWRNIAYCVIDNTIYSGTTNIGTIGTSTGLVSIGEMSQNAGTPYLCISDGAKLYLVSTSDVVTTIDNTQVQSTTITTSGSGATTGTWSTTGGGGTGATGTFTVTAGAITSSTVTTRGTGYTSTPTIVAATGNLGTGAITANLCAFPSVNIISIVYLDGYIFAGTVAGRIFNCDVGDPTQWQPSSYLAAEMFADDLVAIARQNNTLVAFGKGSTQFFYDAANATGSPLANVEQAALQYGTASFGSISQHENFVCWIAKGNTGGYYVNRIEGSAVTKRISTEPIERVLNDEETSISSALGYAIRYQGHFWYVLKTTSRTFLYDHDENVWHEWEYPSAANFPMVAAQEVNNTLILLHATNGKVYKLDADIYQDEGVDFTVSVVTSRIDMETTNRKIMSKLELGGDIQSSSSVVTVEYSDDDYTTWSTARSLDMINAHNFLKALGSFRRRAFRLKNTGNTPLRLEYLEVQVENCDY